MRQRDSGRSTMGLEHKSGLCIERKGFKLMLATATWMWQLGERRLGIENPGRFGKVFVFTQETEASAGRTLKPNLPPRFFSRGESSHV